MSVERRVNDRGPATRQDPWSLLAGLARLVSGARGAIVTRVDAGMLDVTAVDGLDGDWRNSLPVAMDPVELIGSLTSRSAAQPSPALRAAWTWLPADEPFRAVRLLGEDSRLVGVVMLVGKLARGGVGRVNDLAALAAARLERAERHERLEALLASDQAIAWHAALPDYRICRVSGRFRDLLGYDEQAWFEPGFLARIVDEPDRDRVVAARNGNLARGRDHELAYRVVRADGEVIWIRDLARIDHDSRGRAVSLTGVFVDVSPQKAAQQARDRREQRIRVATEAAPIVTWEWDVESGRVEADVGPASGVNAAAPERLHVRDMLSRLHPEDHDTWWNAANGAIDTGQPFRALVRRADAEQENSWLVVLAHPVERDPVTGRVRRFVAASIDVTDHRRAQAGAALWRERVLNVCEPHQEALAEWDIASDRMEWLHAPQGVLGQPITQLGRSADLLGFVHPDDLPAAHAAIIECLKGGPYWHCSLRWRVPDGSYRWLFGQGFVRRNESGRATRVLGIVYDDDELQRTLERQHLQSAMLDRLGEPVIALDEHRHVVVANRALEAVLGAAPGELTDRPITDFLPRPQHAELRRLMDKLRAVRGGVQVQRHGFLMRRADGPETAAELYFGHVEIRQRSYWVGVGHDVTKIHRQRRQIMEAVVSEQQRLAIELHDGLSQELTGLSLLLSAIASRHAQHKPIDEDLERAADLVASAIETTRDVSHGLSAHRVAQGGLASALQSLAAATGRRTAVRCATRIDAGVSRLIDVPVAHQLARIAQEAVSNAVRHGKPDEILIELGMHEGSASLCIVDNGAGIDHTTPSSDGMGLQILRYRADIVGGVLQIEPRPGGGTRVSCVFPLNQNDGSGA